MAYKIIVISVFLFIFTTIKSYSQDVKWVLAFNEDNFEMYYERNTMKYEGDNIMLFIKHVFKDESSKVSHVIWKIKLICGEEKFYIYTKTFYYKNGESKSFTPNNYSIIFEDSPMEKLSDLLCN
jgi:hypothetical protein